MSKVIDISHLKPSERGGVRERERERERERAEVLFPGREVASIEILSIAYRKSCHHKRQASHRVCA